MDERAIFEIGAWALGMVGTGIGSWYALKSRAEKAEAAAGIADNKAKVAHDRIDALEDVMRGKDGLFALAERIKGVDDYARETRLVGLHNTRNELGDRLSRLEEWKDDHHGGPSA